MTTLHYVKKSQHDIWSQGKRVTKVHLSGKHAGTEYVTYDTSQCGGSSDKILIYKGNPYYWWQFRFGGRHVSSSRPPRSALTQSSFLAQLWDLEDEINGYHFSTGDDPSSQRDEWVGQVESLLDETQSARDNMPEQLQENSESGQLLQERIDALEIWISELEGVDCDLDEDSLTSEAKSDQAMGEEGEVDWESRLEELTQERLDEILGDLQNTSSGL